MDALYHCSCFLAQSSAILMASPGKAQSLEQTPTWAVAVVCFVLVAISIVIEHLIHVVEKWLKKKHKIALVEALEKVKADEKVEGMGDPERFRFARETSFGRRHMQLWSKSLILLWIAHLAPGSETRFNFQKYISRSLDEDFKVVVGISPIIWFIAVLFLLTNTHGKAQSLEQTPTWAVAVVCFVLVAISIVIEHLIHVVEKWLKKKHKIALAEALEKVKAGPISDICIPENIAATWHPCSPDKDKKKAEKADDSDNSRRRLLQFLDSGESHRRFLASKYDKCAERMRKWRAWEVETTTLEYQYHNDPERFRFARETSFGRRHMQLWSKSSILLWIVCFFRQFLGSVTKVDYMTLRHGFIMAHLAPGIETRFNFQKYISRSLDEDFKVVVGISPIIWFIAVLFLLTSTHVLRLKG
uniref:MLO-like protein n=1 Tax=Salix viminalis TaxID=40686 RepID=A0A6N2M0S1_SALVM